MLVLSFMKDKNKASPLPESLGAEVSDCEHGFPYGFGCALRSVSRNADKGIAYFEELKALRAAARQLLNKDPQFVKWEDAALSAAVVEAAMAWAKQLEHDDAETQLLIEACAALAGLRAALDRSQAPQKERAK
jgi:hypothetical protein